MIRRMVSNLRLTARATSLLALSMVLVFFLGTAINPGALGTTDSVLLLFFFGSCAGMILAWRWEGIGGIVSVASLAALYLANRVVSGAFPRGWAFVLMGVPGLLFLMSWLRSRSLAA